MGGCKGASASAPSSLSSKILDLLHSDDAIVPSSPAGTAASPWSPFPWDPSAATPSSSYPSSMFAMSPWIQALAPDLPSSATGLVGSLVRQEGHVYSLAAAGDLLYTGSDSLNIRVWKGRQEFSSFRSSSGLVKAIVVAGGRVFTGHQDGKIRVWRRSSKEPSVHRRVGTLPSLSDFLRCALNPSSYVEVRRHRSAVWLRHFDAVSCLSLDEEAGLLYSGSWDKTVKVWRVTDSKCLESFAAHDDAVNAVAAGFDGLVFTGSADGKVKVWRREETSRSGRGRATRHVAVQTLLRQEGAVTALTVAAAAGAVYCGSSDGVVSYWRREGVEGRPLGHGGELRGHVMAVLCLAAAGRIVASGSADRTVRVWRREESSWAHSAVAVLTGHAGPIKCLAVEAEAGASEGARYVVYSGSLDKSVNIWRVAEWERVTESALRTPRRLRRAGAGDGPSRSPLHRSGGDGAASHV